MRDLLASLDLTLPVPVIDDRLEVREGPADTARTGAGAGRGGGLGPGGLAAAQQLHDREVQGEEVVESVERERRGSGVETALGWVSGSVQSQPPVYPGQDQSLGQLVAQASPSTPAHH